jgi:hypothetical protein
MMAAKPLPKPFHGLYRPRRVPVTIAVGLVYDEGIVFCADTKVTYPVKGTASKLPFYSFWDGRCALQFAISSDDVNFPKSAVSRCVEMVEKLDASTATIEGVKNAAEFALGEFYREHIYTHPDRMPGQVFMQMLLGIWLRNEIRLYSLHETILMPVEEYECLGAGEYLSKYLINQYKRANPAPFTLADAAVLATYCVEEAIGYDDRCGGEAETLIMRNSGECDNAHRTALYPAYLINNLRDEGWRFLKELAFAQTAGMTEAKAPGIVEDFCDGVRRAEKSSRLCWSSSNDPKRSLE